MTSKADLEKQVKDLKALVRQLRQEVKVHVPTRR